MNEYTARRLKELANQMAKVLPLLLDYEPMREAIITELKLDKNLVNGSLPLQPIWSEIELDVIEICRALMEESEKIEGELNVEGVFFGMCDPDISVRTYNYGPIYWVHASDCGNCGFYDNKNAALAAQDRILEQAMSSYDESEYEIEEIDGVTVFRLNENADVSE